MFPLPFITRYLVEMETLCVLSIASGCFCFNESVSGDGCGRVLRNVSPKALVASQLLDLIM